VHGRRSIERSERAASRSISRAEKLNPARAQRRTNSVTKYAVISHAR